MLPDWIGIKPIGYAVAEGMPDKGIETWCWLYRLPFLRRLVPAKIEGYKQVWFGGRVDRGLRAR